MLNGSYNQKTIIEISKLLNISILHGPQKYFLTQKFNLDCTVSNKVVFA